MRIDKVDDANASRYASVKPFLANDDVQAEYVFKEDVANELACIFDDIEVSIEDIPSLVKELDEDDFFNVSYEHNRFDWEENCKGTTLILGYPQENGSIGFGDVNW